ncbi:MAG: sporulation transcription factor Spo0A [Oscillospiraceae bacterium]|nr:sporulation transcription factor Spo0A [Oscillospiraceae bacterium]
MPEKLKIVIALDQGDSHFMTQIMSSKGFEAITLPKDGSQVIKAIKTHKPDVVLMELYMSNADGIGVMEYAENDHNPIYVIASPDDKHSSVSRALKAGASHYAIKPFDCEMLASRIVGLTSEIGLPANDDSLNISKADLEMMVTSVMHQIGVPAHIKGYQYLRTSIILCIEEKEMINLVTKALYPQVARIYETTSSRVERAIRHAIEVAWDRGDVDTLNSYFGFTVDNQRGKPTNSEFIAMISDKMRLKINKGKQFKQFA